MTRRWIVPVATGAAVAAVGAGGLLYSRRAKAATGGDKGHELPECPPTPLPPGTNGTWKPEHLLDLPLAAEVGGDYDSNWGSTPGELRPLFLWMENSSGIRGSGRLFAVIAYGESRWVPSARNGDGDTALDERERVGSRRAWKYLREAGFPLKHGEAAAEYGSGGLFGALSPYFLATGRPDIGKRAPLRDACPDVCLIARVAAWGAVVYMQRLLDHYRIDDHADIKVGWASPSYLLSKNRGGDGYKTSHAKFERHAKEVGIDLTHTGTIPKTLSTERWPGVLETFESMVGELPRWVWS